MELSTPGPHWYVNVIEPVEVSGDIVTWRDMIADVEAFTDGTFHIADIPELVHARRSLPADVVERVRQTVVTIVDDVTQARPPFRRTVPETPYGSEESRFWLVPGAGDGLAVIGDVDGAGRPSVERMLARLNPASLHHASVNPLMVLPPDAPPRDGVLDRRSAARAGPAGPARAGRAGHLRRPHAGHVGARAGARGGPAGRVPRGAG